MGRDYRFKYLSGHNGYEFNIWGGPIGATAYISVRGVFCPLRFRHVLSIPGYPSTGSRDWIGIEGSKARNRSRLYYYDGASLPDFLDFTLLGKSGKTAPSN